MAIIGGFNIYFSVIGKQKQYGTASGEFWSPNQTFQLEDIPAIELGNKDFKILVITDIHLKITQRLPLFRCQLRFGLGR